MRSVDLRRKIPAGVEIIREGELGDFACIVESGVVEISTRIDGEKVVLATRGAGEIIGEMAIVDRKPRSATVTTLEDCEILLLSEAQLRRRLEMQDPIMRMVFSSMLDRFRETIRQISTDVTATSTAAAQLGKPAHVEEAIKLIELEFAIREALKKEQFVLFYQPLIACEDLRVASFEALARWRHPERGLIGPHFFIDAADEAGLLKDISRWAVDQACLAARRFETGGLCDENFSIAVNVTANDICDPSFIHSVSGSLARHDVGAARIGVEITESNLMSDPDRAIGMLNQYANNGVAVSIDDFGTGYSSLNYLARYRAQRLKIDKSFVDDLETDPRAEDVVRAIVALGKMFGMRIVAEGVETEAQAVILRELGCDYYQGYLFAKPMQFSDCLAFTQSWRDSRPRFALLDRRSPETGAA